MEVSELNPGGVNYKASAETCEHDWVPEFKNLKRNHSKEGSPMHSNTWNPTVNELTEHKCGMSSKPKTSAYVDTEEKVKEEEPDAQDGPERGRTVPSEEEWCWGGR